MRRPKSVFVPCSFYRLALSALLGVGCGSAERESAQGPASTQDVGVEGDRLTIMQAGAIDKSTIDPFRGVPSSIHFGFTDSRQKTPDHWTGPGDVPVQYDAQGRNQPVVVTIPDPPDASLTLLGYVVTEDPGP